LDDSWINNRQVRSIYQVSREEDALTSARIDVLQTQLAARLRGGKISYWRSHELVLQDIKFQILKYRRMNTNIVTLVLPRKVQASESRKENLKRRYENGHISLTEFIRDMMLEFL